MFPLISASKSKLEQLNGTEMQDSIKNCHVGHTPLAINKYIVSDRLSSKCTDSGIFIDYVGSCDS